MLFILQILSNNSSSGQSQKFPQRLAPSIMSYCRCVNRAHARFRAHASFFWGRAMIRACLTTNTYNTLTIF